MGATEDEKIGQEAGSIAREETKAALSEEDITAKTLAKELKLELQATEKKASCAFGKWYYSKPLIDWKTRQSARVSGEKLLDLYPAEHHKLTVGINKELKDILTEIEGKDRGVLPADQEDD